MAAPNNHQGDSLSPKALFYMFLLSIQFGIQPILTKQYTPPTICRSTVILLQEGIKFVIAGSMLYSSGNFKSSLQDWSMLSWVQVAALPACLYSVQNLAALLAYQNLDALSYNVLNQTKTLSAAMCCYFVMGRKQSKAQILSLFLLLGSALVIEKVVTLDFFMGTDVDGKDVNVDVSLIVEDVIVEKKGNFLKGLFGKKNPVEEIILADAITSESTTAATYSSRHFTHGVAPVLLASFISGLAGALSQKNLQKSEGGRNPYLFSMELCAASTIFLGFTLLSSDDGKLIQEYGFFHNWTIATLIPIVTNAMGGIIVGLVTKYAGSVRKGFALIFGILLSGLLQQVFISGSEGGATLQKEQIIGGILAGISLWAHATHPYIASSPKVNGSSHNSATTVKDVSSMESSDSKEASRRSKRKTRKED